MAKKTNEPVPENNPQAGGSFTRDPDTGALTQTEGPDMQVVVIADPLPDGRVSNPPPPLPSGEVAIVKSIL